MLTLYIATALIGGTLIVLSALGGLGDDAELDVDHDVDLDVDALDVDVDVDVDVDADADVDAVHALDVVDAEGVWLPFLSLRFWTYTAAGFGLTGSLLTWLGSLPAVGTAIAAGGTGLVAGLSMAYLMRAVKRGEASGQVRVSDYVGAEGTVMVAIAPGAVGKIRTRIRGEEIDLVAVTAGSDALARGEAIMIIEMDGAQARVVRRDAVLGD